MKNISLIICQFFQSKFSQPFLIAFLGYCWVAVYLSPKLTWEEIEYFQFLWNRLLSFDSDRLNRIKISDLSYYVPIKLICFLGFPAIMGANLAAFFSESSNHKIINRPSMFCWLPLSHPQPFYPEIVIAFVCNKFLNDSYCKIHIQFMTTVLISVLASLFIVVPVYDFLPCLNPEDSERLKHAWDLAKLNLPIFITHYNPLIAFLFGYLGISITRRIFHP